MGFTYLCFGTQSKRARRATLLLQDEERRPLVGLGSILNSDLVDNVVSGVDAVFHLAAAVGV
ncbi:MAG: hypothetical protein OTJ44_04515, partial [Planctomycetota bacterium]|nr:hypothetical protein [Planctomycetota bacterium]